MLPISIFFFYLYYLYIFILSLIQFLLTFYIIYTVCIKKSSTVNLKLGTQNENLKLIHVYEKLIEQSILYTIVNNLFEELVLWIYLYIFKVCILKLIGTFNLELCVPFIHYTLHFSMKSDPYSTIKIIGIYKIMWKIFYQNIF